MEMMRKSEARQGYFVDNWLELVGSYFVIASYDLFTGKTFSPHRPPSSSSELPSIKSVPHPPRDSNHDHITTHLLFPTSKALSESSSL